MVRRLSLRGRVWSGLVRASTVRYWPYWLYAMCGPLLLCLGLAYGGPIIPAVQAPGAALFTSNQLHYFRIEISPEGLESLRQQPRQNVAARVLHGGTSYSNVAVHLKGRTGSFRTVDDKPGLTLDFDEFQRNQTLQGLTKVHLDNSVEDPAYLNQMVGTELFRLAGIPAPRVTPARVDLNGRKLGVYLLREGFASEFLATHFGNVGGAIYEPVPAPTGPHLRRVTGRGADSRRLAELNAAIAEPKLSRRWKRLDSVLDMDRFISFMALEVMLGHRDGYCLAANNYRLYLDPETARFTFLPHGMDQLWVRPDLPLRPAMSGPVAAALFQIPEARQLYRERTKQLFTNLLTTERLTQLIRQHAMVLRETAELERSELRALREAVGLVQSRVISRLTFLAEHLDEAEPAPVRFVDGRAQLSGWEPMDAPAGGRLSQERGPGQRASLHIQAGPVTSASWRTSQWLEPGRYRFQGHIATAGVRALAGSRNKGAGLRVTGVPSPTPHQLTGDSSWTGRQIDFTVPAPGGQWEFVCELRASAGEAWFDLESLQIVEVRP